jgi:hypothetical protein
MFPIMSQVPAPAAAVPGAGSFGRGRHLTGHRPGHRFFHRPAPARPLPGDKSPSLRSHETARIPGGWRRPWARRSSSVRRRSASRRLRGCSFQQAAPHVGQADTGSMLGISTAASPRSPHHARQVRRMFTPLAWPLSLHPRAVGPAWGPDRALLCIRVPFCATSRSARLVGEGEVQVKADGPMPMTRGSNRRGCCDPVGRLTK